MRNLTLFIFFFLLLGNVKAQVIFSEDFDGIPGPTAGGAGTYVFPAGWFLRNVDNRTPDPQVAYVNEAWERREDFGHNVGDSCAFSTSYYSPVGAADDWMWTPLMGPLPANPVITWNAVAYDPAYLDGYEVRIMTSASGPPTGGTGSLGNQVSNSTVIFSTAAESSTWTSHSVNLAAYAGQSVYIGFRNNSNDKFILAIDDIVVQNVLNYDAGISSVKRWEYSMAPQPHALMPMSATVTNNGVNAVTGVTVTADLYDQTNALINSVTSPPQASLLPSVSSTFTFSPYALPVIGTYRTQYSVAINEADQQSSNNTLVSDTSQVTDSVFARDRGAAVGTLGIGSGNGGYVGQQFVTQTQDLLTSVSVYLTPSYSSFHVSAAVFAYNNGAPTTMLAHADTIQLSSGPAGWFNFPLSTGPLTLPADTFVVVAVEVDSTLTVGQTIDIYTAGAGWVNWPTNPFARWAHPEEFGAQFAKTLMVRANFGDVCANFSAAATGTDATCGSCADGSAMITSVSGYSPYTYAWSSGSTTTTESNLLPGTYTVTVTDAFGCVTNAIVTIGNTCASFSATVDTSTVASCGSCADGTATAGALNGTGPFQYAWSNGDTTMTADSLLPGNYIVTVMDVSGCSDTATVTITFSTGMNNFLNGNSSGIFPNPSNGNFTLFTTLNGEGDVEIFSITGECISRQHYAELHEKPLQLFVATPGSYIVKVRTNAALQTLPVIVN